MEDSQAPTFTSPNAPREKHDAPTPITKSPSGKTNKKSLWALSIALVLAIAAAITFAVLYFAKSTPPQPPVESLIPEEKAPVSTDSEEVEITDTYILRDLDEKIAILHYTDQKDSTLDIRSLGMGYFYSLPLYKNGTLSDVAKLSHVAKTITPDHYLTPDEIQSAIAEQGYSGENARQFEQFYNKGIKAEKVVAKYLDVFGEELVKGAVNDQYYCPKFYYNSTYDLYYDPGFGCGGTGPYDGSFYKNKYTTDSDHAFVYISTGVFNAEDNKIYCDIIDEEILKANPPAICGESEDPNNFKVDVNNYQDFAQYRFVFNKADNGTYYFNKVEKL